MPNSSRKVTSWVSELSSAARSRSLRRTIIRSAASTSWCMSAEMECRLLKRKCGFNCIWSACNFASRQPLLQFHRAQFALPVLAVIVERETDRDNDPVDEQVEMPRLHQQRQEGFRETRLALPAPDPGPQDHVREGKHQAGGKVHRQTPPPVAGFKIKPPRQPDDRDGQQREHVPVPQRVADRLPPGHLQPRLGAGNVKLKREGQPDQRPKAKPQQPFDPASLKRVFNCHVA